MSRILVADDNSNIQKMVALALKDEGIDVVAVGNGDAAMRKIPDLRPDLVLADVFMPVRNGYEVCEFVKSDSRYMSTPVVLLVGAFDPLDEQETQRVRADGVLKKPFVPPDPLINMVKALLAKSNGQKPMPVSPATVAAPTIISPPVAAVPPATVQAAPAPPPVGERVPATTAQPISHAEEYSATVEQLVLAEPSTVSAPAPQRQSRTAKSDEPDEVTTAARDPKLGEPFWAMPEEAAPEEIEPASDEPKDMVDMHSFGKDEPMLEDDRRESVFRPELPAFDAVDLAGDRSETSVPANQGAPAREEVPLRTLATGKEGSKAAEQASDELPSIPAPVPEAAADIFKFDPTLTFATPSAAERPVAEAPEIIPLPEMTESPAEARPAIEKPRPAHEDGPFELPLPSLANHDAVITAATEAARLAFSELNALPYSGALPQAAEPHASETKQKSSPPGSASVPPQASPTPEMIEAVVNRLLEQMQPQIMEVVNREVLRPAIEAIVRREMKKS